MEDRVLIKESEIDENLVIKIYHTEEKIILEISCMGGKYMIIKNYTKNLAGEKSCQEFIDKFKSVDDVFDYFKIKGRNK
jgi:uncharacterized protein (DUF1330 family)